MNNNLPEAFVKRMRHQLGEELPAFLHALDEPPLFDSPQAASERTSSTLKNTTTSLFIFPPLIMKQY